jgi:hypothetical protein
MYQGVPFNDTYGDVLNAEREIKCGYKQIYLLNVKPINENLSVEKLIFKGSLPSITNQKIKAQIYIGESKLNTVKKQFSEPMFIYNKRELKKEEEALCISFIDELNIKRDIRSVNYHKFFKDSLFQ